MLVQGSRADLTTEMLAQVLSAALLDEHANDKHLLLLIDDEKAKTLELNVFCEKRMSSNDNIYGPVCQLSFGGGDILRTHKSG